MFTSYSEFLFESLTTIRIFYSKDFKDRLNSIYNTTKNAEVKNLCRSLLNAEDTSKYRADVSFIDLTDRNDKIYFTPFARLKRLYDDWVKEGKAKNGPGYGDDTDIDTWLYFQSADKFSGGLSDAFTKYRQELGIGRFVGKIFREVIKVPLSDSTIEKFVNEFKSMFDFEKDGTNRLEIVSGEDIRKWYLYKNYSEVRGQLGNSCMRYDNCQEYLDIYVENPEVCKLLVMWADPSKTTICGRSLVWTLTDGKMVMDRIYTVVDYQQELFSKYAKDNGIESVNSLRYGQEIQLKKWKFTYYPYMDNFLCLNINTGILVNNDSVWPSPGWYKLQNTGGEAVTDEVVWSEYHSDYIHQNEAVWCEGEGDYCHENDAIYLEYKDEYVTPNAEISHSVYSGENYHSDDCVYSDTLGDNLYLESAIQLQINYYGDDDWFPADMNKYFVKVKYKGEFIDTLEKFTIFNPITNQYHFLDEEVDDKDVFDIIQSDLEDVVIDHDRIKKEVKRNFIDENTIYKKLNSLFRLDGKWTPYFRKVGEFLKYLIINYPPKSKLRNGRLKTMTRQVKVEFKSQIIRDTDLMKELGMDSSEMENFKNLNEEMIHELCFYSFYFVRDFIKDPEVLKMWYKDHLF
jgi:hypothetical protein